MEQLTYCQGAIPVIKPQEEAEVHPKEEDDYGEYYDYQDEVEELKQPVQAAVDPIIALNQQFTEAFKDLKVLSDGVGQLRLLFHQSDISDTQLLYLSNLVQTVPKAGNIVLYFKEMIAPARIFEVLEVALRVREFESMSLMITQMNDEMYSLMDIERVIRHF